ncbi:WRKY family transcription factor, partial [Tanacetum coccineum]
MTGATPPPTQPKQPIDKAYSIASIKAYIPTPLDLDKLNYNAWSALFTRFCRTYKVHHHLDAPTTTETSNSTIDPLHESNDSLVVMWMYSTISPKLVEMVVDDDTSSHGVWKRLTDLFQNNKDARVTQLDNEIRNMAIGSLSVTDFFQEIKSKAYLLSNLDSPVKDTSLATYAVNGIQSKYSDAARVIRLREKSPTFDELWSMMLLEENDMSHKLVSLTLLHNTPSSPTVLVSSTTPTDKANTMSTSGFDVCRNFQCGSCSYGARCRTQPVSATRASQQVSNVAPKPIMPNTNSNTGQPCMAQNPQPVYLVQPTNMGYVYFYTGPSSFPMQPSQQMSSTAHQQQVSAQPHAFGPTRPFQPAQLGSPMSLAQQGPPDPIPSTIASQFLVLPTRKYDVSKLCYVIIVPSLGYYASIGVSNYDTSTTKLEHGYWGVFASRREH